MGQTWCHFHGDNCQVPRPHQNPALNTIAATFGADNSSRANESNAQIVSLHFASWPICAMIRLTNAKLHQSLSDPIQSCNRPHAPSPSFRKPHTAEHKRWKSCVYQHHSFDEKHGAKTRCILQYALSWDLGEGILTRAHLARTHAQTPPLVLDGSQHAADCRYTSNPGRQIFTHPR